MIRTESSATSATEDDPQRAFYRRVNPRAEAGEALALIAPLDAANTWSVVRRTALGGAGKRRS